MRRNVVVLLCLALLALAVPTAVSAQETCPPAGGAGAPRADAEPGDIRITGGGWGHGAGMSQYGAQGAGLLGCDARTIVETYFPGATVETPELAAPVRVNLDTDAESTLVDGAGGRVPWELCEGDLGDRNCTDLPAVLADGATWQVIAEDDGSFRIRSSTGEAIWSGGSKETVLRARLSSSAEDGRLVHLGNRYRWGVLEFDSVVPGDRAATMFVNLEIPSVEQYLYGLSEVPASWPEQTLQAQAITARSYALTRVEAYAGQRDGCRCDLYATTFDQVYRGYEQEVEGEDGRWGQRWVAAVDASAGEVLRYEGQTVEGFYSSSHGGYSESGRFVFGGDLPYLQPVDDTNWEAASGSADAGVLSWSKTVSAEELGGAFDVGTVTGVRLPDPRGNGCRVGHPDRGSGGVVITGTGGEVTVSGDAVRRALGLRSTLFRVGEDAGCDPTESAQPAPPAPPPATPAPVDAPPPEPDPEPAPPPVPEATPAPAPAEPVLAKDVERLAGASRVETAVEVSRANWIASDDVVLATARAFPDALAAGALAARLGAPLLLVEPDELPPGVAGELERLGARRVRVLGGSGAVAAEVEDAVRALGVDTVRIQGAERYATAREVALAAGASDSREVVLALGRGFADGVAAGALSAVPGHRPTLLTDATGLPAATERALAELGTRRVLVIGGEAAIAPPVEERLRSLGYDVERLAGASRFDTSAAVTRAALQRFGGGDRPVVLATGGDFPDALAAGALAARVQGPLQLVPADDLDGAPGARDVLAEQGATFRGGLLVGGEAVVSEQVRAQAIEAISG